MNKKPTPKGSLVAALDIGSSKVACFIGRALDNEGNFEILGVGHHASAGVKNGIVSDLDQAEATIRKTVHAAENMAADFMKGYPLREVVVNVPSTITRSHHDSAKIQILGHEITDNDVRRALAKAQEDVVVDDYELIHTVPIGYSIDGHKGIKEPRGMYGQDMQVDIHMISGDMGALRNMATSIERSHLDISAFCSSAYAAGLAALVDDEMDLGCTVIDIGGGITSFAVFHERSLIYCDSIEIGGQHITSDIAKGLTTSLASAERLKALYGSAMGSALDETEMIDVPQLGEDEHAEPHHVPRSILVGIIQPRIEEIFEMVRAKLQDSGLGHSLGRRVVLTGGSSQTPGLRELAQHVLDKQVRLGKPIHLTGLPDAVSGPAFATAAGLLNYISDRSHEMPADIMEQVEPGSIWERTKLWLHENW